MFKNLIDKDGNRVPQQSCNHRNFEECMCDCHVRPSQKKHFIDCCVVCPYCERRIPLRYFSLSPY